MPTIPTMIDLISKLESPFIDVHRERCVLVRNRNAQCLRCAEACTSGCISYDGDDVAIAPENCIGCGTCATACPTCALEAHHPNDAELLRTCRRVAEAADGQVCIACAQLLERAHGLYDSDKVAAVECLGRVEETLLTTLAAEGVHDIVLVRGGCERCDHATGWAMAERVCETERQLLEAWNCPACVRVTHKLPGRVRAADAGFDQQRRELFAQGSHSAAHAAAVAVDTAARDTLGASNAPDGRERQYLNVMEDGTLPHFVPDRRERLLDALAALGQPQDTMIDTRLWGHVIIDPATCTSCQMCAVFCPTGALSKYREADGTFGVEHYPGDCVKCRTCTSICPTGALTLSENVFAVDVLAGMVDRYPLAPRAVDAGSAHSILDTMKRFTLGEQVYER